VNCVIVDFGLGNLRSVQHKLRAIEIEAVASADPKVIAAADRLILPGVGHFAKGMENLKRSGLIPLLTEKVMGQKTPVLGVCLGMQLLTRWSEEGEVEGLGWIDAVTKRFQFNGDQAALRIPHIGWNTLQPRRSSPLLDGIAPAQRFYFVHSYHVCCDQPADVLTTTRYGYEFVSVVHHANILGAQFHPEKSHRCGMTIVKNFFSALPSASN